MVTPAQAAAELKRRDRAEAARRELERLDGALESVEGMARWRHAERYQPHRFAADLSTQLDAFAREMEAGGSPRWTLSAPPGHGKTDSVGRSLPPLLMGRAAMRSEPWPVVYVTSDKDRAKEVSLSVRSTVERLHVALGLKGLAPGQPWTETHWATKGGHQWIGIGSGSSTGGIDARTVIGDDVTGSGQNYASAADRGRIRRALEEDWMTRIRGPGGFVLMETRRGIQDPHGYLHREYPGQWRDLTWRLIAEAGDADWRQPGEYLWPERYGADWHSKNPQVRGRLLATLYQQRPTPDDGALFLRAWLSHRYAEPPSVMAQRCEVTALSLDSAATEGAGDHSVLQWWGWAGPRAYLLGQWRGQWGYPTLRATVLDVHARCRPSALIVEDTSAGRSIADELARVVPGLIRVPARGPKRERIAAETPAMEAGQVCLPEREPWAADLVERLIVLTGEGDEVDDEADALAMALRWRRDRPSGASLSDLLDDLGV